MDRKSAKVAELERASEKADVDKRHNEYVNGVSRRINAICAKFGISQKDLARITEVSYSRAGNWLNGNNGIQAEEAGKLCGPIGVSLDWVYLDRIINMTPQLAVELAALIEPLPKEAPFLVDRSLAAAREARKARATALRKS